MTTELDALLAAVIADPADDLPRLVAADWLEERAGESPCEQCKGVGLVWSMDPVIHQSLSSPCQCCGGARRVSNGAAERAAFIRVQCELAGRVWTCPGCTSPRERMHSEGYGYLYCFEGCDDCDRHSNLKRHERELWPSVGSSFRLADDWDAHYDPANAGPGKFVLVRRGFVESVTCTAEQWIQHGDAIRAKHPVTDVTLTTWPQFECHHARSDRFYAFSFRHPSGFAVDFIREEEILLAGNQVAVDDLIRRKVSGLMAARWDRIRFDLSALRTITGGESSTTPTPPAGLPPEDGPTDRP